MFNDVMSRDHKIVIIPNLERTVPFYDKSKADVKELTNSGRQNWLWETKLEDWYFLATPTSDERYI